MYERLRSYIKITVKIHNVSKTGSVFVKTKTATLRNVVNFVILILCFKKTMEKDLKNVTSDNKPSLKSFSTYERLSLTRAVFRMSESYEPFEGTEMCKM
jgi:hypothetical protein